MSVPRLPTWAAILVAAVHLAPAVDAQLGPVIEVTVSEHESGPARELEVDDLRVRVDGEPRSVSSVRRPGARHFLLLVDLPGTSPADRRRALPPLAEFFRRRIGLGDRVTVAILRGAGTESPPEVLCAACDDEIATDRALRRISEDRRAAFQARRQRGTDSRREVRDAFRALTAALPLAEGDGLPTAVFYLGREAADGLGAAPGRAAVVVRRRSDPDTQEFVGSVQYLVSLPRTGAPMSKARGEGDRLLSAALQAEVSLYPLADGGAGSGIGAAADETGGRPLSPLRLRSDLEGLEAELDRSFLLTFEPPPADDRFHAVRVEWNATENPEDGPALRHIRGFRAVAPEDRLDARAASAWRLGHRDDGLGLDARLAGDGLELTLPAPSDSGKLWLSLAVPVGEGLAVRRQTLPFRRSAPGEPLRLKIPLRLPENFDGLGLALVDAADGRTSTVRLLPRRPRIDRDPP